MSFSARAASLGSIRELASTAAGRYFRAAASYILASAVALKAGNRFADYAAHLAR